MTLGTCQGADALWVLDCNLACPVTWKVGQPRLGSRGQRLWCPQLPHIGKALEQDQELPPCSLRQEQQEPGTASSSQAQPS